MTNKEFIFSGGVEGTKCQDYDVGENEYPPGEREKRGREYMENFLENRSVDRAPRRQNKLFVRFGNIYWF